MNRFTRPFFALVLTCLSLSCISQLLAESSIIVDNQTGRILEGIHANDKLPVASLTKLALAMVTLDYAELKGGNLLGEVATVPEAAISTTAGINPLGLQAGDTVTLRDLLYACLLASDNVAAYTLADYLGKELPNATGLDPVGNTVANMNALARQLIMRHTLFLNPHGLDIPEGTEPYSSAADLARLTRYAYSKAGLAFYVAQSEREIHVQRGTSNLGVVLHNTNPLLGTEDIDGVKTGRTSRAGDCIILTSEHKPDVVRQGDTVYTTPRRILVVLLGGTDRAQEGLQLVRRGWALYDDWAAKGRTTRGPTL